MRHTGRDPFKLFQYEFERRFQRHNGKYDYSDFAFELFKEKQKLKKLHTDEIIQRNKIEYGI